MLLPYDIRPDREGWTIFDVTTQRPVSFDDVVLIGLSLEHAETAVNALNALEIRCQDAARRRGLDDMGVAWLYKPVGS
jgi:hypothetical protein